MAMEPLQTTYKAKMDAFVIGMIPDMRTPGQDISRAVESVAAIPFGAAVAQGATADRAIRPMVAAAKFVGVTVLDVSQRQDSYARYSMARVRTKGPVVVAAGVAVKAGDDAYVVPAGGAFTNVPTGNTLVGQFETTGAAGALVILNLK